MDMAHAIQAAARSPAFSNRFFNWALCWIVLSNLVFCGMWLVGGPPRFLEITVVGVVGLVVRKAPFAVKYAMFVGAFLYSIFGFVSGLFNLSIQSLAASVRFLFELQPGASPEYVVMGICIAATLIAAWRLLRLPTDFEYPWEVMAAAGLALSLASLDHEIVIGLGGSHKRLAPAGAPFESATGQSRFVAGANGRHLMIVMVESMGVPRDPTLKRLLLSPWTKPEIEARYEVQSGSTTFYGSTTSGEVRELCGRWGDYPELMEGRHDCLPAALARRGYQTTAYHSFAGNFFDRTLWYPKIGFQQRRFRDYLLDAGADPCPGVFPGACDRDVPAIIGADLRASDGPQLVYWLTVNSHLPVPPDRSLRTENCAEISPDLARTHAMSCRLFSLWSDLAGSLATFATDPTLPPTDILIVGDHGPPFFERRERALYEPGRVPWILLRHRGKPAATR